MKEKDCMNCKHFESYQTIYDDDLEPDDCGICHNPESPHYHERQEDHNFTPSEDNICAFWEP